MFSGKSSAMGYFTIVFLCISLNGYSSSVSTISNGEWRDKNIWNTNEIPFSTDTIIIYHKVVYDTSLIISPPGALIIEKNATLCIAESFTFQSGTKVIINGGVLRADSMVNYGKINAYDTSLIELRKGFSVRGSISNFGYRLTIKAGVNFSCYPPIANFQTPKAEICQKDCIGFIDETDRLPQKWSWSFPGGVPSNDTTQNPVSICYPFPGQYEVKLTVSNSAGTDSIIKKDFIYVKPVPSVSAEPDTSLCKSDTIQLKSTSGYLSDWSPKTGLTCYDCPDPLAFPAESINYLLTITDTNKCSATDSIQLKVLSPPLVELGSDATICLGEIVSLNSGSTEYNYLWSNGENKSSILTNSPGVYWVMASNQCGIAIDSIFLNQVEQSDYDFKIPTVFTPNGDGYNERFSIKGLEKAIQSEIIIFDRWGTNIFTSNSAFFEWEGYNGKENLPEGVYFYLLKTRNCKNEEIVKNGTVTILR
ncbi:MAG: hypothetical protein A3H98_13370 [Bacteroidetes bacterium RIFCSPLOWO2_02_FULL_36_8]|nr:MAG: hypothetical protein A3H98_13370 [Bacteroidetes bacterium RIFCSPLOWO2_02_FULL_36_8]